MKYEFNNNTPIYIQLVEMLKISIISGELKPGDKLPSVRELALLTKVNPNTMQKALVELEELSLVYTERTNGKYVTTNTSLISRYKEEHAKTLTEKYFMSMELLGFNEEETIKYLKNLGGNK